MLPLAEPRLICPPTILLRCSFVVCHPPIVSQVRIAKPGGKKAAGGEQRVVIGRLSRNRRKFVTVVGGLDTFPGGWTLVVFCSKFEILRKTQ